MCSLSLSKIFFSSLAFTFYSQFKENAYLLLIKKEYLFVIGALANGLKAGKQFES